MTQLSLGGSASWFNGADFSKDRAYRYTLWRRDYPEPPDMDAHLLDGRAQPEPVVCWVMLNPSTADETVLDPTLRRCRTYSRAWGYRGFYVVNLFALRSTDPQALYGHSEPVGPRNDDAIRAVVSRAALVMAGWGKHGAHLGRADTVTRWLAATNPLYCLDTNKDGSPRHPLYLPKTLRPRLWAGEEDRPPDGHRDTEELLCLTHDPGCDLGEDCTCRS